MLSIRGLSKTYAQGVQALSDVDLEIHSGLFGLLGPNGAGKSTLMRVLATLLEPDRGSVFLDGRDVLGDPVAHRRRLGYLPQEFGVYPGVRAIELLDHLALLKGITDRGERRRQVDALLQRTHLWEDRRRKVATYSGGMRRRFGIAQALLGAPRLVIVDEPTAGLDPEERLRFHDLLAELGEEVVVLLSTHIVADVHQLCSEMAILSGGQIVAQGRPGELLAELRGRIWRKTIERRDLDLYRSGHDVISTRLVGGRKRIHVLADEKPDATFESIEPDLEDVYFATLARARPTPKWPLA